MGILDKKKKVFGNIAAAKTLTESMPKLKKGSSFPSMNNKNDVITFLTDLIKSLIGQKVLVSTIVEFLTTLLPKIEVVVKKALKVQLKSIVSCGINPSIPDFIKSTGTGIIIPVNKIDFTNLFKTDPTTAVGKLLYMDSTAGLTSTDLNTFIYSVIQDDGVTHTWKNILDFKFVSLDSTNTNPNNSLIIKTNIAYDTKSLNDLNNDFVDSLELFDVSNIVNNIIDIVFGSISVKIKKTSKQLEAEGKINNIVDKLVNLDEGEVLSDTYFTFNSDELLKIQSDADDRKKGRILLNSSTLIDARIEDTQLTTLTEEMGTAVTVQSKKEVLTKNLESMAASNAEKSTNPKDKSTIEFNFIQTIITNVLKAIVGVILTPKIVFLFLINFKVIYGPTATFTDGVDFIKKNSSLFKDIVKTIVLELTKFLLSLVLKHIAELVAESQKKKQIDKQKNKIAQLLSLIGTQQEAIRTLKGLS